MLGIELLEGDYDVDNWLKAVRGFEHEPEKGERCAICFDRRFEVTAKQAAQMGEKTFTSTLLTSPKKSLEQLKVAGDALAKKFDIEFLAPDYRKASGTQEQNIMAKEDALYRQDYCGCVYALNIQRDSQKRLADELFSPISQQVLPESIESRIALYEKRWELEENEIEHKIVKQRFLNWRQMHGLLRVKKETVPAHFLPLSTLKSEYTRGKVDNQVGELYYMNRDEVKFVTLESYNLHAQQNYQSVQELIFSPPTFEEELKIRFKLMNNPYDLSCLIVVEEIPTKKLEILYKSHIYEDVKEVLIERS